MRHRISGRKLGRNAAHRKALFRNMVTALFEHERIQTTDAKAKELRRVAEKLITLGKRGDLHARRQALAYVRDKGVVAKLFEQLSPRYAQRPGGYTRIVKLGIRRGDAAPVSLLELVQEPYVPQADRKKGPAAPEMTPLARPQTPEGAPGA
ncbi:MAG: 50S ribosomal protein L17 [Deferrisomatales bacterium]